MDLLKSNDDILSYFSITHNDIEDIDITCATELEFWVKTPNDKAGNRRIMYISSTS